MTSEIRWDDGLRGVARRIAEVVVRRLRVVAGPGTGKTFSLMRRVARLLQREAVKPRRILVCTFTRTAARDLQDSLQELGVEGAAEVRAGTIHSFCFWLLSREEVLEATGRVPRPLLGKEERFLIEDIKGPFGGVRESQKLLKAFNATWARLQTEEPGWPASEVDRAFEEALDSWLRFHRGMLLGELVPVALHFLRSNPANPVTSAFDHVIVDEYQDLNRSEQVLLDLLSESGDLTIVGDADQSIYSFKHAHPEGIASFGEAHTELQGERLEECRRCPHLIVEIANRLISHNRTREPRVLVPRRGNPAGEVHVVQWHDMDAEAEGVALFLKARIESGEVDAGKVLVLAPRRQFGYAIRDALKALGTPAHSFFQEEALDGDPKDRLACRAQEAFTLLNLLVDPEDRVALRCWCGFGSPSLRSGAWRRLWIHCEENAESPREALQRMAEGDLHIAHCSDLVDRFLELRERLDSLSGVRGRALVDALFPEDEDWAEALRAAAETIEDEDVEASSSLW